MGKKYGKEDEDFKTWKQDLDEDLEKEKISVSDDLVERTLNAIQQKENPKVVEQKKKRNWKYRRIGYMAASLIMLFLGFQGYMYIERSSVKSKDEVAIDYNMTTEESEMSDSVNQEVESSYKQEQEEKGQVDSESFSIYQEQSVKEEKANKEQDALESSDISRNEAELDIDTIFNESITLIEVTEKSEKSNGLTLIKKEQINRFVNILKAPLYKEDKSLNPNGEPIYTLVIKSKKITYKIRVYSNSIVLGYMDNVKISKTYQVNELNQLTSNIKKMIEDK